VARALPPALGVRGRGEFEDSPLLARGAVMIRIEVIEAGFIEINLNHGRKEGFMPERLVDVERKGLEVLHTFPVAVSPPAAADEEAFKRKALEAAALSAFRNGPISAWRGGPLKC